MNTEQREYLQLLIAQALENLNKDNAKVETLLENLYDYLDSI